MIYKLLFIICFIAESIHGNGDKVTLQVYYETYDFDSRLLIATDLKEAVDLLDTENVNEMYAYGFAETDVVDGKYEFTCENGPEECEGNKFDACALDILGIHSAMALINCVIDPLNGLNGEYKLHNYVKCWQNLAYNDRIHECSISEKGSELLKRNGDATRLVHPRHLPLVLINGKEWNYEVSLFVAVCEALVEMGRIRPPHCF